MKQAVYVSKKFLLKSKHLRMICTPNPEMIINASQDPNLLSILNSADMVIPDGIGLVIASKILYGYNLSRVTGYDLIQNIMKHGSYKFYFLGSQIGVAKEAAKQMQLKYPNITVAGYHHGFFQESDIKSIIKDINNSEANVLIVGLGSPKQEFFISKYRKEFSHVKLAIGAGGSLDVMANKVKRAPKCFRRFGLEWFYRLITDPSRAKRMLNLPLFLLKTFYVKISNLT
ncbi:N-acetylmannosaminyltransferase [Candidatus Epulonipiscioides saccharophilum]|nr:N-acetylmannosaminyltransferase [Epulopiscium sp. SCG-B10WGA-EpuloB]